MQIDKDAAVYVISVAAELAGMHPQTLRQYDRLGLVVPQRTAGRGRRYSADDISRLQLIQRLSQEEGINLAGIKRILELQREVETLGAHTRTLAQRLEKVMRSGGGRVFAAGAAGDVVSIVHGTRPELRIAGALAPGATARAGGRRSGELTLYRRRSG
ncbi:helix-turn-helix transcriptional regulator [Brevibacterium sp. CS2]|uniref:heat shock protein transcriptional repressor HspR n=1 Tax=Brevibacterium sp. CS2 TaxID=2575923 RepID=UPI0010C7BA43|nr:helix-turn-helix transcriptional regulator [Brevibacterium sp. CS2]QCP04232.1 MerR family transcriptional regulator [Brevibacterium sp. CS2]